MSLADDKVVSGHSLRRAALFGLPPRIQSECTFDDVQRVSGYFVWPFISGNLGSVSFHVLRIQTC